MDRTWTTYLVPRGFAGYEADQVQDLRQRDRGSDLSKVNARHGGDPQVRVFRTYDFGWATLGSSGDAIPNVARARAPGDQSIDGGLTGVIVGRCR